MERKAKKQRKKGSSKRGREEREQPAVRRRDRGARCATKGISYRALAEKTGLSAGYLNHLVHGNRPVPANAVIETIAKAVGMRPTSSASTASAGSPTCCARSQTWWTSCTEFVR